MTMTYRQYTRQKFDAETRYDHDGSRWFYTWCRDCKDSRVCESRDGVEDFQNSHDCGYEEDSEGE